MRLLFLLFSVLAVLCAICQANFLQSSQNEDSSTKPLDSDEKAKLRAQMASLLDMNPSKLHTNSHTKSRSTSAATRWMQKLYLKHAQNPGPNEGSTIRSISPKLLDSMLQDLDDLSKMVFDLGAIRPNEQILRAELHFNQRAHHRSILSAAGTFKARVSCSSCPRGEMMTVDVMSASPRPWATFLITDLIDDAIAHNQSEIAVQFLRRNMLIPAPKVLCVHSPFLLVFTRERSQQNEGGEERASRSKRSLDSYYQYMPVDSEDEGDDQKMQNSKFGHEIDSDAVLRDNVERFRQMGPRLLKERVTKKSKSRRSRYDPNDPMLGFGKVADGAENQQNRVDKNPTLQSNRDQVTLHLLGSERARHDDKKQCSRQEFVVNFRDIGWDSWIIAPKKFEAHYCAGSCEFPLVQDSNPSNHAHLQAIAQSLGLLPSEAAVCCAPDRLDSQTLLYYDESGNVVLKNYPKMVVSSCACL